MWWSERVQLQVLGGSWTLRIRPTLCWLPWAGGWGVPSVSRLESGEDPELWRCQQGPCLLLSLTHSVHTISPPTFHPSLRWPLSGALVTPLALDAHSQGSLQPLLRLPAHPSFWPLSTVPSGQSTAPSQPLPGCSLHLLALMKTPSFFSKTVPPLQASLDPQPGGGSVVLPAASWPFSTPLSEFPSFKSNVTRAWHLLLSPVAAL